MDWKQSAPKPAQPGVLVGLSIQARFGLGRIGYPPLESCPKHKKCDIRVWEWEYESMRSIRAWAYENVSMWYAYCLTDYFFCFCFGLSPSSVRIMLAPQKPMGGIGGDHPMGDVHAVDSVCCNSRDLQIFCQPVTQTGYSHPEYYRSHLAALEPAPLANNI